MDAQTISRAVDLLSSHGYWFLFFAMVIEGPVVTAAAAFAAALGVFDVYIVFLLSVLANLSADVFCYALGYWGRLKFVEKYGKRFGINAHKVKRIEKLLVKNAWATIAAIKIAPGLATPGLIIVGASRVGLRKYIEINIYLTLLLSLPFVILGYYAGLANVVAERYLHHSQYWLILAAVAIVAGSYLYRKVSAAIARRIEKI